MMYLISQYRLLLRRLGQGGTAVSSGSAENITIGGDRILIGGNPIVIGGGP